MAEAEYLIQKAGPDDLDQIFSLYCENNREYDQFLELNILSERVYTFDDFVSILQDDSTRTFLLLERVFCEKERTYYREFSKPHYENYFKGFISYELLNGSKEFSVLFLETDSKKIDEELALLRYLTLKLDKKHKKISWQIPEDRVDLLKTASSLGLHQTKMTREVKGPDIFCYEFERG